MARNCDVCGRGALRGNVRSHSNVASKKHRKVNLQMAVIAGERVKACTSCIKTASKQMAKSIA
ncbi:MAG: hypothetical protein A3F54_03405 [Candidatus Kerfeldbacteria bacterium RIFCSPHIGHO2_12_FULL_48_17]|uniref:50S ribosomal protein L28 n=1 Tax=Candidatus Kerfeldbacteria bacterium RIFCSPHIGHO2_12_FULL_48_17 TaxID=1798542 RepID=A0A1G2B6I6_9BACT|nr:MAG: hypothetical protein A3F54_03405 [Candidatus Kerfeldbacteria bacterium RIFCSPHIGHO2_12_FULL_48_17]